eukprot:TRINITY_DN2835_c0_g1_i3.p1 TRINITY_DN2835_c0_g1~~TRINITY_DN2835_c0_g1_i3.p1  ORF type:complete len:1000 (-),score=238.53 TRINITY_DN2835_c0_g1_i3:274-3273(-)
MDDAHAVEVTDVSKRFQVNLDTGLSRDQVLQSRKIYGRNEMKHEEGTPFWKLVVKQFDDLLIRILLAAALISFILALFEEEGERLQAFVEPVVIFLILIANATVGVLQESNAEHAIEALKTYEPEEATVVREGRITRKNAVELVPGDVVEIQVGDRVPADLRVCTVLSTVLRVDQSILTGESSGVMKHSECIPDRNAVVQDKKNMLFLGTTVERGKARGIVTLTGGRTAMGQIRREILEAEDIQSPMKKKLDEFGEMLSKAIMVICILVWVININHFWDPSRGGVLRGAIYYFKIAVALAVAAIPEGLPAVVTTCLALGTVRMARKKAIVRSLPSVETLGCTSVICSDKTGTLTTNKMSVSKVLTVQNVVGSSETVVVQEYDVEGTSFDPVGKVRDRNGQDISRPADHVVLQEISKISALCNEASIVWNKDTRHYNKIGESTEAALKVLTEKIGSNSLMRATSETDAADHHTHFWEQQYPRLATMEFTRDRKSMSVLCRAPDGTNVLLCKGAPEAILERSSNILLGTGQVVPLTPKMKDQILQELVSDEFGTGRQGLRNLAFSFLGNQPDPRMFDFTKTENFPRFENKMTFVGIAGMLDPPRIQVMGAIEKCRSAGIRVIVVTGDNKVTAEAICRRIGIFDEYEKDVSSQSFTGREFDSMKENEKVEAVKNAHLFSRVEPSHKSNFVEVLQSLGETVAMTGDGVNDAPALRKADIGVAMGSGTAVAKGAGDMVLADDNFATIVASVEEGRAIYNNTKQFIRYLISSNIGEVMCIFLTAALGMPEALIPVQLLWVNLVTDGLPATALGFNPPDADIMKQPPRHSTEPIVNRWLFIRYVLIGVYVGVATVSGFAWWFLFYEGGPHITWHDLVNFHSCNAATASYSCAIFTDPRPACVALSVLVTVEMCNALNGLSENQSLLQLPPWKNMWLLGAILLSFILHFIILYVPFLAGIFAVAPLSWGEWKGVLYLSIPVILLDEVLKFFSRRFLAREIVSRKKRW